MTGLLASFAYLSAVRFNSDVFVVDVRTPVEVSAGYIESAWGANVPLSVIWRSFKLPADEFESRFGARKPSLSDEIIVTCRSGGRSTVAQKILEELGYTNVLNFKTEDGKNGGYNYWLAESAAAKAHSDWQANPEVATISGN
ncbi:Oidioi.mRNA.OKI2018_I69.PAR.g10164.t1.cds [Oikopleura dioica]|uniref:Oidioi.mRNA.OKI2018_I69.PAR.g10164.t1.cds n=1 Tax=Oikopleura dioica TaxID=34765 RepID=A0ABN7RP92_OIKDI|nr:Oidioi.mRNA.OKI2018_I69.PAR.g10164.t1.cds [Oikopleura dioica]